jgi:AraC-like DNA-binding protein
MSRARAHAATLNPMEQQALAALVENSLSAELYQCSVTAICKPHSTGWRLAPFLITAQLVNGSNLLEFDVLPQQTMMAGEALVVCAGVRHRFTLISEGDAVSNWSHVQFKAFASLDIMAIIQPPKILGPPWSEKIGGINRDLTNCKSDLTLSGAVRRRVLLFSLLDTILSACPDPRISLDALREAYRVAPTLAMISDRLGDSTLSVDDLAANASLSPSRFHTVFKTAIGTSPSHYVQQQRMARAEQLLIGSDFKIREIATRSGWADEFHFSRLFKQVHGISPLAYREQAATMSL